MSDVDRSSRVEGAQLQDTATTAKRTALVRQNSDLLLSYYESSIPNEAAARYNTVSSPTEPSSIAFPASHHTRSVSGDSTYSGNEARQNEARDTGSETSTSVTKRLNTPSKGGADRRRLAIVQLDSSSNGAQLQRSSDMATATTTGSIRSRRGYKNNLSGLALIVPPDAASDFYSQLNPPSTAPLTSDMLSRKTTLQDKTHHHHHHRSASDVEAIRPLTRISRTWRLQNKRASKDKNDTTMSRNSSPLPTLDQAPSYLNLDLVQFATPIATPQIGEAKELHVPVAPPVVMNLGNVVLPSSFTDCEHGQSVTINKTSFVDDPTPSGSATPRQLRSSVPSSRTNDSLGQGRSLGTAASKSANMSQVEANDDIAAHDLRVDQTKVFTHKREGATAVKELDNLTISLNFHVSEKPLPNPNSNDLAFEDLTPRQTPRFDEINSPNRHVLPHTPLSKAPTSENNFKTKDSSPPTIDHSKFDKWLKDNPHFANRNLKRGLSLDEPVRYGPDRSMSPLSADNHHFEPPEPPLKGLRRSLTTQVKRLSSISRAASLSSKSASRSSQETRRTSRTPSPLSSYPPRTSPLNPSKTISMNPAALFCHEIGGQTTTLQRCIIYANKINELSTYDCGLADWVVQMKDQALTPQRQRGPSTLFVPNIRRSSRSSVISEATFPRRLDATTATDLSPGQFDDLNAPTVPQLPYPSLAARNIPSRASASTSSTSPPTSLRSLAPSFSTSGFFSALGRKASLSRKDRPVLSTRTAPPGVTPNGARLPPSNQPAPRPIQITTPPTIPGGPRAPPSRSKRAHVRMSLLAHPSPVGNGRDETPRRSPSVDKAFDAGAVIDIKPDPAFSEQVDKLASLIPQADRNILADYLRRTGSDILALGKYLEDERLGVVRSH